MAKEEGHTELSATSSDQKTKKDKLNDLVKVKIMVNVWDHEGNKQEKNSIATLQRNLAQNLLEQGKAVRIDPLPELN
jgi:hypothetical protein